MKYHCNMLWKHSRETRTGTAAESEQKKSEHKFLFKHNQNFLSINSNLLHTQVESVQGGRNVKEATTEKWDNFFYSGKHVEKRKL